MKKFVVSEENAVKVMNVLEAIGINYYLPDEEEASNAFITPTMTDGAQDQPIEPENIDKVSTESQFTSKDEPATKADISAELGNISQDFLKAQLSTKNQMKLRNLLAIVSSIAVVIAFILEKLGIL